MEQFIKLILQLATKLIRLRGDLIDPSTGDLIDPSSGDLIDPTTGDLIDPTTGDLIDPTTGDLIDPTTLNDSNASDPIFVDPITVTPIFIGNVSGIGPVYELSQQIASIGYSNLLPIITTKLEQ